MWSQQQSGLSVSGGGGSAGEGGSAREGGEAVPGGVPWLPVLLGARRSCPLFQQFIFRLFLLFDVNLFLLALPGAAVASDALFSRSACRRLQMIVFFFFFFLSLFLFVTFLFSHSFSARESSRRYKVSATRGIAHQSGWQDLEIGFLSVMAAHFAQVLSTQQLNRLN